MLRRVFLFCCLAALVPSCIVVKTYDGGSDDPDTVYDDCQFVSQTSSAPACDITWNCDDTRYHMRCNFAQSDGESYDGTFYCECIEDGEIVDTFESEDVCGANDMTPDAKRGCGWYLDTAAGSDR